LGCCGGACAGLLAGGGGVAGLPVGADGDGFGGALLFFGSFIESTLLFGRAPGRHAPAGRFGAGMSKVRASRRLSGGRA
jgi:hypothetical protein